MSKFILSECEEEWIEEINDKQINSEKNAKDRRRFEKLRRKINRDNTANKRKIQNAYKLAILKESEKIAAKKSKNIADLETLVMEGKVDPVEILKQMKKPIPDSINPGNTQKGLEIIFKNQTQPQPQPSPAPVRDETDSDDMEMDSSSSDMRNLLDDVTAA